MMVEYQAIHTYQISPPPPVPQPLSWEMQLEIKMDYLEQEPTTFDTQVVGEGVKILRV